MAKRTSRLNASKQQYDALLEQIEAWRREGDTPPAREGIRRTLAHRSNYIVSKAALAAGDLGTQALIPDLLAAYARCFEQPTESDPQCWAKNGILDALVKLDCTDADVYLRGLRHVQLEPVMGGVADTAGPVRARCAIALVSCRSLTSHQVLQHLLDLLADPEAHVRAEAARAIGNVGSDSAALLLRLRVQLGDPEPEVLGACFSALLATGRGPEKEAAIRFVAAFLGQERGMAHGLRNADPAPEAALALGATRDPQVVPILVEALHLDAFRAALGPELGEALVTGLALTQQENAWEFLLDMVARNGRFAEAAVRGLRSVRMNESWMQKLKAAIESSGNARLLRP